MFRQSGQDKERSLHQSTQLCWTYFRKDYNPILDCKSEQYEMCTEEVIYYDIKKTKLKIKWEVYCCLVYPTTFKGCAGIVFTHSFRVGGSACSGKKLV